MLRITDQYDQQPRAPGGVTLLYVRIGAVSLGSPECSTGFSKRENNTHGDRPEVRRATTNPQGEPDLQSAHESNLKFSGSQESDWTR